MLPRPEKLADIRICTNFTCPDLRLLLTGQFPLNDQNNIL